MSSSINTVLFVSPCEREHEQLRLALDGSNWALESVLSCREAWMLLHQRQVGAVIMETACSDGLGWRELLEEVKSMAAGPAVIVATEAAESGLWARALDEGAFDILMKPFDANEVAHVLARVHEPRGDGRKRLAKLGAPTVVVVDAPEVQLFVRNVLGRRGYHVLCPPAGQADTVLNTREVALVITDRPERLRGLRPDQRLLYTSLVGNGEVLATLPNRVAATLRKPFKSGQLLAKVETLMATPAIAKTSLRYRDSLALAQTHPQASAISGLLQRARDACRRTAELAAALREAIAHRDEMWGRAQRCYAELETLAAH